VEKAVRAPRIVELRELLELRYENARLKRMVADVVLDRRVSQEVFKKDLAVVLRRDIAR
jgi:hypothetical protein